MAQTGGGLLNWAGSHTFRAARVHRPETVAQVQQIVADSRHVRAVGSRHSFHDIADTAGDLVSFERLNRVVSLDRARRTVTVEAGIRYGDLGAALDAEGFTLHNFASLPHISVAGACATATHGSGDRNGNLATAVREIELVTASGEAVTLSRERDGERFLGAVAGLGALGLVTRLTLAIEPAFQVRQYVYLDLPVDELDAHFAAIMGSAYSVSLFTDWTGPRINQVWLKHRVADEEAGRAASGSAGTGTSLGAGRSGAGGVAGEATAGAAAFFGATPAAVKVHPLASLSPDPCTEQLGIPGPAHTRLPHFRLEFTPSSGAELQSEYFVPRRHAMAAFHAVHSLREQIVPRLMMSEVRTIAADELWLSPQYRRDSVALHFTWVLDTPGVVALLPALEERLAPFDARPHWGKLFTTPHARLRELYPRLPDFVALRRAMDPQGKFSNDFLQQYVLGEP